MKNLSYEKGMERLDAIVKKLEKENLPLEEHLKLFEESIKLHRHCSEILNKAEKRIELLLENEKVIEKDFDKFDKEV